MMDNKDIIQMTKEITVAKLSNSTLTINKAAGENVAEFMHSIYTKLVELNKNEDANMFPKD